jgi:hypothetical protein
MPNRRGASEPSGRLVRSLTIPGMNQSPGARARARVNDAMVRAAEGARDSIIDRLNRPRFHDAAEAALGIVSKRIEALDEQVESGRKLAQQDHYLHKKLRDMKLEMEQALQDLWESSRSN